MFAMGFTAALGAMTAIGLVKLALGVADKLIRNNTNFQLDDSDAAPDQRSDMKVLTDAKTGLQYLAGPKGGLLPRWADAYGEKQVQVGE